MTVKTIIAERFRRWSAILGRYDATPLIVIGVSAGKTQLVVLAPHGVGSSQVAMLLADTQRRIVAGDAALINLEPKGEPRG